MEKNVPKKVVNGKSRKESSRLSKIYFPGGREIASSRLPGKHRPDSREDFLCSLRSDNNKILRPIGDLRLDHHGFPKSSPGDFWGVGTGNVFGLVMWSVCCWVGGECNNQPSTGAAKAIDAR
jgi:hypothetical protein